MKRKLIAFLLGVALVFGIGGAVSPSSAGATPVPCPVGSSGWFEGASTVFQCVIDDYNHHVIREWGPGGTDLGVVFNSWTPDWVMLKFLPGSLTYGTPAVIDICGSGQNTAITRLWPTSNPYWEHEYRLDYWISDPQAWLQAYAGNINHFHGWSGIQAFGGETALGIYSCPYGLGQRLQPG